jgi:hypothetical protein
MLRRADLFSGPVLEQPLLMQLRAAVCASEAAVTVFRYVLKCRNCLIFNDDLNDPGFDFRHWQVYFYSPKCPYCLWGLPTLKFTGYRGSFLRGREAGT